MWHGCGNGESVTACVEGCGVEKGDGLCGGIVFGAHMSGGKECLSFKVCVCGFLRQAEV